jgi:signal transduction histidine kinase
MDAQEERIYLAVIISVLVVGSILAYLSIIIFRQQRKTLVLQKANAIAEINAMEKERARIAADLHDDLGPVLSVIKFRIDGATPKIQEAAAELKIASKELDEVIEKLREIAHNLLPAVLQKKGPIPAIEDFIYQMGSLNGLKADIEYPTALTFREDHGIQIYRIVQEAVNNCIKHAGATKMQIIFREYKDHVKLFCQDNGKGIEIKDSYPVHSGRGLQSMKNRIELMGGSLKIESKIGVGTILIFEIPVK